MTTQHTPGPWNLDSNQFMVWDDKHAIASVHCTNAPEPMCSEARANARLIAAAPELLQALQACEEYITALAEQTGNKTDTFERGTMAGTAQFLARAAIKKATE